MMRVMQVMRVKVMGMNDEMKAKMQAMEQGDGHAQPQGAPGRKDTSTDCGGPANSPAQSTQDLQPQQR